MGQQKRFRRTSEDEAGLSVGLEQVDLATEPKGLRREIEILRQERDFP